MTHCVSSFDSCTPRWPPVSPTSKRADLCDWFSTAGVTAYAFWSQLLMVLQLLPPFGPLGEVPSALGSCALQVAGRGLSKHPGSPAGKPTLQGTETPDSQPHLPAMQVSYPGSGFSSSQQAFRALPLGLTSDGRLIRNPKSESPSNVLPNYWPTETVSYEQCLCCFEPLSSWVICYTVVDKLDFFSELYHMGCG